MHIPPLASSASLCRRHVVRLFLLGSLVLAALTPVSAAETNKASAPKLFWGSDPINAGETAMFYGDGIATNVTAEGWRVTDETVTAPPAKEESWSPTAPGTTLEVLQASGECAKTVLPKDWSAGIFAVRLKNGTTTAEPFLLNRPELWWWLGGENDQAYAGEELRIFGKNFGDKSRVWMVSEGGQATALTMLKAEKYAVKCQLPKDLTPGKYAVWLHNGFGGKAGFGKPLSVAVAQRTPWPTTRFNVKDFGADGNEGKADATWAIQSALKAAEKNGGGEVYLPGGVYRITGKMIMPAKTVLKGESRDAVQLVIQFDNSAEIDSVIAGDGDFGVEDLTITASTARRIISCPLKPELRDCDFFSHSPTLAAAMLPESDWGHNVHLRGLCIRHLRRSLGIENVPMRPQGWAIGLVGRDMEVTDCDIMSSDDSINYHGRRIVIERNRLAGATRPIGVRECVYAENSIRDTDQDNTGNGYEGEAYRLYIANNRYQDIYGWDREAITFDAPYGHLWMGQVAMSSPTVMTIDHGGTNVNVWGEKWKPGGFKGDGAMICSGKGLGQFIPIVNNDEKSVTLERPWVIEPDATSWVVIRVIKNQVALHANQFEDAGKSIQLYANTYGFIIDGNTSLRAGGTYGRCRDYLRGANNRRNYNTCAFNQWFNNTITMGTVVARDGLTFGELGPTADPSTLTNPITFSAMGNVVRNNVTSGDVRVGSGGNPGVSPRASHLRGRDTVIEGNTMVNTMGSTTNPSGGAIEGIVVSGLFKDTVLRGNRVAPCPLPLRDDGINTWIHPAARLGYQIESVKSVLGDSAGLKAIRGECDALANKPVDQSTRTACEGLTQKLLALVAATSPQIPADLLQSLTGVQFEIKATPTFFNAVRAGKGGQSLKVLVRSQPWSPALNVQAALSAPGDHAVSWNSAKVALPANSPNALQCQVGSAQGTGISALDLTLTVTQGNVTLQTKKPLEFNRQDLSTWLVSSPQWGWKAHTFASNEADLGELGASNTGTICMVAGVEASEPVSALLDIGCIGGEAKFYLNDKPVASLSQLQFGHSGTFPKSKIVRVSLEQGTNLLLCKVAPQGIVSSTPKSFTLRAALITDPSRKDPSPICEIAPDALLSMPTLQQGNTGAAGAVIKAIDDFKGGVAEGWKFTNGNNQNYQVVDSGDPSRGKVLKRTINYVWNFSPAVLYREFAPGTLNADSQLGIRFWMKTEEAVHVEVSLMAGGQKYSASVGVGTEWQEYRVPFDQFIKPGPTGEPITPDALKKVSRISFLPVNDSSLVRSVLYMGDLSILEKQPATAAPSK
jgi:hypothetical protein